MKQFKIFLAVLCTLLLAAGCSKEIETETETTNRTNPASLIKIGDFPAFDEGAGTRIGKPDPGKTAWAEGDKVLLKLQKKDSQVAPLCYTLTYHATSSSWDIDSPLPSDTINDYRKAIIYEVTAYYAPAYQWSTADKGELVLIDGKSAGTDEFLTFKANAQLLNGISINFSGARPYSRLRVSTNTEMTVKLSAPTLTPAGTSARLVAESLTTTSDDKGNAYFYGSWTANTEFTLNVSKDNGQVLTFKKKVAASEAAMSYALDDPYYEDVLVTKPGQLYNLLYYRQIKLIIELKLAGEIEIADFRTIGDMMPNLKRLDMRGAVPENNIIPMGAFYYNGRIEHIDLPDSITEISNGAFYSCNDLTDIKIPNSVTRIGREAFDGCSHLAKQIVLPRSLKTIDTYAFRGCDEIPSFKLEWENESEIISYYYSSFPEGKPPFYVPKGTIPAYIAKKWPADLLIEEE